MLRSMALGTRPIRPGRGSVAARLGAFAVAALVAFGGGAALGWAVGPIDSSDSTPSHEAPDRDSDTSDPPHDRAPEPTLRHDHPGGTR